MIKTILLLAAVFSLGSCKSPALSSNKNEPFTGSWSSKPNDYSSFTLDLVQTGTSITGCHIAVAHHGNRLDSGDCPPPSITGKVISGVAHVRFQSGYSDDAAGTATIILHHHKLEWKIQQSSGVHYLPESCTLSRDPK